jgi:hypothetical protein
MGMFDRLWKLVRPRPEGGVKPEAEGEAARGLGPDRGTIKRDVTTAFEKVIASKIPSQEFDFELVPGRAGNKGLGMALGAWERTLDDIFGRLKPKNYPTPAATVLAPETHMTTITKSIGTVTDMIVARLPKSKPEKDPPAVA